jgi:major membrane immunogen (membrane-anchored lipoprotein)
MIRKKFYLCALFTLLIFSSCKSHKLSYQNGVYTGISSKDDRGAYGEIEITFENDKIANCSFVTYQKDGKIKGEDYGKVNGEITNRDYYEKAQLAVFAMKEYALQFQRAQNLEGVDAIAGATVAYDQFIEAAKEALGKAKSSRVQSAK